MKPALRLALGAMVVLAACVPTDETMRTPRYTLVMGIDVSGSFHNSGSYDDALRFAAYYLEAHLNGFGGLQVPTSVFVGSVGGGPARVKPRRSTRFTTSSARTGTRSKLT